MSHASADQSSEDFVGAKLDNVSAILTQLRLDLCSLDHRFSRRHLHAWNRGGFGFSYSDHLVIKSMESRVAELERIISAIPSLPPKKKAIPAEGGDATHGSDASDTVAGAASSNSPPRPNRPGLFLLCPACTKWLELELKGPTEQP